MYYSDASLIIFDRTGWNMPLNMLTHALIIRFNVGKPQNAVTFLILHSIRYSYKSSFLYADTLSLF